MCFAEEENTNLASTGVLQKYSTPLARSDVQSIFILPASPDPESPQQGHGVAVVYKNGEVQCFSGDLKNQLWCVNVANLLPANDASGVHEGFDVCYSALTDSDEASKGILKYRDDVVAQLTYARDDGSAHAKRYPILCLVTKSPKGRPKGVASRSLHILSVGIRQKDTVTRLKAPIQYLVSFDLPETHGTTHSTAERSLYALHAASGTLHENSTGSIVTYDFSGITPRIQSELLCPGTLFSSFVRLAPNLVMASSSGSCAVYDTRYTSLQGSMPLNFEEPDAVKLGKRKHPDATCSPQDFALLDYFDEHGLVLGLANNQLVGANCLKLVTTWKRRTAEGALLLNSIGKGLLHGTKQHAPALPALRPGGRVQCSKAGSLSVTPRHVSDHQELDKYAADGNVPEFERAFAKKIGLAHIAGRREPPSHRKIKDPKPNGLLNGVNGSSSHDHPMQLEDNVQSQDESRVQEWQLPPYADKQRLQHKESALYALGKIFTWADGSMNATHGRDHASSLAIRLLPPNVFRWLVHSGYLSLGYIEQALRQNPTTQGQATELMPADMVLAVIEHDTELRLLHTVLSKPTILSIFEIVQAIKALIQSLDNTPLPHLADKANELEPSINVESKELITQLSRAEAAAQSDLDLALSTLDAGLAIRSQALRQALTQLHAFPAHQISQILKAELTQHETIFLIQILRIELADGGWTSRYVDVGPASSDFGSPSDRAIALVADLLSCALDAVGAGGWVSGSAGNADDGPDELLLALRGEISAALEGIHEATFMRGLFNEIFRYGWRQKLTAKGPHARRFGHGQEKSKSQTGPLTAGEDTVLPLGLKIKNHIEETKVEISGEIKKRSKRDIGMQKSKRVGEYTFERIRI